MRRAPFERRSMLGLLRENGRRTMETVYKTSAVAPRRRPWNKGKLIGPKPPLQPKHVWAIRTRLQLAGRTRDLALFNPAIDSKLRACHLVSVKVDNAAPHGYAIDRACVRQNKTGRGRPAHALRAGEPRHRARRGALDRSARGTQPARLPLAPSAVTPPFGSPPRRRHSSAAIKEDRCNRRTGWSPEPLALRALTEGVPLYPGIVAALKPWAEQLGAPKPEPGLVRPSHRIIGCKDRSDRLYWGAGHC